MKRLGKRSRGSGNAAALCRAVVFGAAALFSVAAVQAQTSADSEVKSDDSRRVYVFLNEGSDNAVWKRWRAESLALEQKKKEDGVLKRYIAEEDAKIAEEQKALEAEREKRAQETRRRDWRRTLEEDRRSANERAEARLALEIAAELERDVLPQVEIDWEAVSLDGATISDNKRSIGRGIICPEPKNWPRWNFGIPATLADVKRTKSWREKKLRNVGLDCALPGESFVGWTFENCRFGRPRRPFMSLRFNTCNFADATISGEFWPSGAITFEQFAATRTFKEGATSGKNEKNGNDANGENAEIVAANLNAPRLQIHFDVDGWEFGALENVRTTAFGARRGVTSLHVMKTGSDSNDRFYPDDPIWNELEAKNAFVERFPADASQGKIWRDSEYCKNKNLVGVSFCGWLNGGDFSGFNLNGAVVFAPNANLGFKLDGATIAGLRVVDGRGSEGAITKEALYSTKSWKEKNLRGVRFTSAFDLRGVDFSGCDLTDACFATSLEGAKFDGATINGCRFERWCWADASEGDDLSQHPLTLELFEKTTNGRKAKEDENLAWLLSVRFPDEIQNAFDRRFFESLPGFAFKDFSGKTLRFRDMSGWDLRGFDLSGCEIITSSLEGADLTGATIDGATFTQLVGDKKINELQILNLSRMKVLLTGAQLASTTTYERDDWRGVSLNGKLDFTGFKFGDWKGARVMQYGGFEGADFTDAEIAGVFRGTRPLPKQVEKTRTFKEGRIALAGYGTRDLAELQRRYALFKEKGAEALQAEDDALEAALADERIFYVYLRNARNGAAAAGASSLSERLNFASQVDSVSGVRFEKESDAKARETALSFEINRAGREYYYLKRKNDDGTFKKYCDEETSKGASKADAEAKATERLQREMAAEEEIVVRSFGWDGWKLANLDGAIISDVNGLKFEGSDRLVFGVPAQYCFLYQTENWTEKRWRGVRFLGGFKPSDFEGWTLEDCEFGDSPKPSETLIGP